MCLAARTAEPLLKLPVMRAIVCSTLVLASLLLAGGCQLYPTEAGEALAHFADASPTPGSKMPDLRLQALDGRDVDLRSLLRDRPLVVRLGSYSCPVFRYRRFDLRKLQRRFADRVDFVVVYTQEAHPVGSTSPYADGEWDPWINRLTRVRVDDPLTAVARRQRAAWSQRALGSDERFLVDDQSNAGWQQLGQAPAAAFVFDRDGNLVLRQPWVEPRALTATLETLLDGS